MGKERLLIVEDNADIREITEAAAEMRRQDPARDVSKG